jgi:hypothetical protein
MTRDNTLIQDPNSLFAISRALRKQIVRTDPNPENRNDAIRDEKHLAYKSTGKGTIETFKYDILTNLEQLDNMFLELETVVPRITNEPAGTVGRPIGSKNKPKAKGGLYGGTLPNLPNDLTIMNNLRAAKKSASSSPLLKKLLRAFVPQVERLLERYQAGEITNDEIINSMDTVYEALPNKDDLTGDEDDGMVTIYNALFNWIRSFPTNAPESLAEPEIQKRRVLIQPTTGNEFVVSTLSKINVLLIKLIAEYNGKILANYKNFLQSDLQEIANKEQDSLARFRDLQDNVLKNFSKGAKSADIDKFVSTIDKNFSRFTALVSRSIANFVNPNFTLLPNFSQQLSGTYQDPKEPFNLYREATIKTEQDKQKVFDTKIDKLVAKYIPIREEIQRVDNEVYEPLRLKIEETGKRLRGLEQKFDDGSITKRERLAFAILAKQYGRQKKELDKVANRLDKLQDKRNAIEEMPEFAFFPRGVA